MGNVTLFILFLLPKADPSLRLHTQWEHPFYPVNSRPSTASEVFCASIEKSRVQIGCVLQKANQLQQLEISSMGSAAFSQIANQVFVEC